MSRYWTADSDLDWQFGNAPPEDAPQEEGAEPVEQEMPVEEWRVCLEKMLREIDEAIPESIPGSYDLRWRMRQIAVDYGNARGACAVKNANAIWNRDWSRK